MHPWHRAGPRLGLAAVGLVASLAIAPAVAAHSDIEVGEYHLTVGWLNEPAYAGQPNGIELFITDHDDKPVTDLTADALTVTVSTAGQDSEALPLEPAFDVAEGFGTPGQYTADLLPTTPGEYTFHFVGSIHDTAVDISVASGEETFSAVQTSSEVEFPVKVPTLADVATRLDRIDARIQEVQAGIPDAAEIASLRAAATEARAAADAAGRNGLLVGGAGLVVAAIALAFAVRAGRRGAGTA